jgi:Sulfotransferase family
MPCAPARSETPMLAQLQATETEWAGAVAPQPATLILIASAGHSGSTLLDLLIGNHPMVSSAGEMNRLTLHAPDRMCACGDTVTNCAYWNEVRGFISRSRGRKGLIRWDECHTDIPLQRPLRSVAVVGTCDLTSGAPLPAEIRQRLMEAGLRIAEHAIVSRTGGRDFKWRITDSDAHQTWILRPSEGRLDVYDEVVKGKNPVRLLPEPLELAVASGFGPAVSLLRACSRSVADFVRIAQNSWEVADAMASVSGRPFVIDSSKSPLRLKLLYMLHRDRVRIVQLVRDGRAVAASAMRRREMSATMAARIWKRDNQNLAVMLASLPSRLKIRVQYEALCENPAREMSRIGGFLGLDFTDRLLVLGQRPVHNIPGNPMLFDRTRRTIKKDERWRRDLTDRDLAAFERTAGRLNRSLGYR